MNSYIVKPKFWINRPHEGPEEFEFDLVGVTFSDGVSRLICKSDIVPLSYTPCVVYNINEMTGAYCEVGSYKKDGDKYVFISID
jgi:hypothetical protein